MLALLLPRWRRRSKANAAARSGHPRALDRASRRRSASTRISAATAAERAAAPSATSTRAPTPRAAPAPCAIDPLRGQRQRDPERLDAPRARPRSPCTLVERRELLRELQRVARDPVRRAPFRRLGDLVGERHQLLDQLALGRVQLVRPPTRPATTAAERPARPAAAAASTRSARGRTARSRPGSRATACAPAATSRSSVRSWERCSMKKRVASTPISSSRSSSVTKSPRRLDIANVSPPDDEVDELDERHLDRVGVAAQRGHRRLQLA